MRLHNRAALISIGMIGFLGSANAQACALPLKTYTGEGAAGSVIGTVMSARGYGSSAKYRIRRDIVLEIDKGRSIPKTILIDMKFLWMGTCGFDSPALHTGERVKLYFMTSGGGLEPRGWELIR